MDGSFSAFAMALEMIPGFSPWGTNVSNLFASVWDAEEKFLKRAEMEGGSKVGVCLPFVVVGACI